MSEFREIYGTLMTIFFNITGGRPMKRVRCLFVDKVNGREVNLYRDAFGRHWMSHGAWDLFRVRQPQHDLESK